MSGAFIEVDHRDEEISLVNIANISRVVVLGNGVRIYFNAVAGFEGDGNLEVSHFEWVDSITSYATVTARIKLAGAKIAFSGQEP